MWTGTRATGPPSCGSFSATTKGGIRLFYLPPYSAELNPDEQVWREVKSHGGGRKTVASKQELKQHLLRAMRQLQRAPHKIRAFFQTPETAYAMAA